MKPLLLALAVMFALGTVFVMKSIVVPTNALAKSGGAPDN